MPPIRVRRVWRLLDLFIPLCATVYDIFGKEERKPDERKLQQRNDKHPTARINQNSENIMKRKT